MPRTLTPEQQAEESAVLATLAGTDRAAVTELMRRWHKSDLTAVSTGDGMVSTVTGLFAQARDITISAAAREIAATQLALRDEGTDLAKRALASLGYAYDGTSGWWVSAFATPAGRIGYVNTAKGIAAETSVTLRPEITEALTAPGQPDGPQVSGAAAWSSPDPGEAHRAAAPEGWVQLLCDLRGGRNLPPLHGIAAHLVAWCLTTCYGKTGEPGWTRLDPPLDVTDPSAPERSAAGWPATDPRTWPATPEARTAADSAGLAALEEIARHLAAGAGLGGVAGALDGDGPAWQRIRAAIAAVPRDPRHSQVLPRWTPAEDILRYALGSGDDSAVTAALRRAGITRLAWACGDTCDDEGQVYGDRYLDLIRVLLRRILAGRLAAVAEAVAAAFPAGSERVSLGEGAGLTSFLFPSADKIMAPAVTSLAGRVLAPCTVAATTAVREMHAIYAAGGPVTVSIPLPRPGPWPDDEPVGLAEIAVRLGVERTTADQWTQRERLPGRTWTVGGRPAWRWGAVREWAQQTSRWPWPL